MSVIWLLYLYLYQLNKKHRLSLPEKQKAVSSVLSYFRQYILFPHTKVLFTLLYGTIALGGPGPPHYRYFTITLRHTTLGRTPLNKWSARSREFYLTILNTQKRHQCLSAGFVPAIPASKRKQAHVYYRLPAGPMGLAVCTLQLLNFLVHIHWDSICTDRHLHSRKPEIPRKRKLCVTCD